MADRGKKLIEETLNLLSKGNYTTIKQQNTSLLKPAPKIFKEDTFINWHNSGQYIVNFIRGLCPIPAAKTVFFDENNGKSYEFKVFKAKLVNNSLITEVGNLWIENKQDILVQAPDGILQLIDLQLSGKKRMLAKELVKGLRIEGCLKNK